MKNSNVSIGSQLYYTDGPYFGEVIKVLKQTVWVKEPSGKIVKRWPIHFAEDMVK